MTTFLPPAVYTPIPACLWLITPIPPPLHSSYLLCTISRGNVFFSINDHFHPWSHLLSHIFPPPPPPSLYSYSSHFPSQLYKGLAAVLPAELFAMFTAKELERVFCGQAEVDIEVLKKATVYEGKDRGGMICYYPTDTTTATHIHNHFQ